MRSSVQFRLTRMTRQFAADSSGASAVEYGLLLALIIVAIFAAMSETSGALNAMFGRLSALFKG